MTELNMNMFSQKTFKNVFKDTFTDSGKKNNMSDLLRFIIVLIFCYGNMHAQNSIDYGIKGGLTMGALLGNVDPETSNGSPAWGPHAGFFAEIPLAEKWAFRPELMYNRSGVQYAELLPRTDTLFPFSVATDTFYIPTFYTSDIKGEYEMHFLELPLKMVFYPSEKLGITFGPRLSWLLKGSNIGLRQIDVGENAGLQGNYDTEEAYEDALFTRSTEEYDDGDTIEDFDLGLMLGTQYKITSYLDIYFDSSIGLTTIQKPSENVPYAFRNFYLNVGFSLNIGNFAKRTM